MRLVSRAPLAAALAALATLAAGCADPAAGPTSRPSLIVNGTPTGSAYGSVGALLYDFDGNQKIDGDDQLCTGSLVSATVFLTAAHCVEFLASGSQLYVSFSPDLYDHPKSIAATGYAFHPEYNWTYNDAHDIAVVFLPASATRGMTPLKLPPEGYLDALAAKGQLASQLFVNVGYGTSASITGEPLFGYDGVRKTSKSEFMGLKPFFLGLLMQTAATGEGGDCYGDSGGPKFIDGDPTTVVATVVTGDIPCRSTSWDYRVDTKSARAFLAPYVRLP
ncbi:MAG: trypsin-like serine protease [Gemmatimonadaceae bacterium]